MNLRRLIAFTGSGATSAFGLPDWDDLARIFVEETLAELDVVGGRGSRSNDTLPPGGLVQEPWPDEIFETAPILAQLARLLGKADFKLSTADCCLDLATEANYPDDKTVVMDLCEEILRLLPDDPETGQSRLFKVRAEFAQHFRKSTFGLLERKWTGTFGAGADGRKDKTTDGDSTSEIEPLLEDIVRELARGDDGPKLSLSPDLLLVGLVHCLKKKCAEAQSAASTAIQRLLKEGSQQANGKKPFGALSEMDMGPLLAPCDVAGSYNISDVLTRELKVGRIATLNYDVQIERAVLRRTGNLPGVDTDGFADLCKDWKTDRPHTKRLVMENLLERGAVSITLGQGNVGDIVNFSAYSRQFGHQVLHLHGRFDDAENIVLTKRDYDRLYMMKAVPRMIFREAQEMLFGGNDILILGIGMSEDDVVRPFRRLMARRDNERANTRRIFLLKARAYCEKCPDDGNCEHCNRKDETETLNNMMRYQIHTLLFGGPVWRATMSRFKQAETAWKGAKTCADGIKAITSLAEFMESDAACLHVDGRDLKLLLPWEISCLKVLKNKDATLIGLFAKDAVNLMLKELKGRAMSRALVLELKSLNKDKGEWWDAWRRSPFERRAIYNQYVPEDQVNSGKNYLWVRHCPATVPMLKSAEGWTQLKAAQEIARIAHSEQRLQHVAGKLRRSRVLRLTAPRGSGKGSLIRLLMHQEAQNSLFPPYCKNHARYEAAFMAHQSFSMEFSSVAKALTRFLARQAAEIMLREVDENGNSPEAKETQAALNAIVETELSEIPGQGQKPLSGREIIRELPPADLRVLVNEAGGGFLKRLRESDCITESDKQILVARRLYVARREDEPRLVADRRAISARDLQTEVVRQHRLEVLRSVMKTLETLCQNRAERLFVCLSGLDRICDSKGDARNPMHRALFRLLCGTTDRDKPDPDPPIDYLFIAGQPQTPIAFLSEEYNPGGSKRTLATEHQKAYSNETRTKRYLRKWSELPAPTWKERLLLSKFDSASHIEMNDEDFSIPAQAFLKWARQKTPDRTNNIFDELHSTREIYRGLWNSVALTLIVLSGWKRLAEARMAEVPNVAQDIATHRAWFRAYIEPLDRAYARDGAQGVLAVVLAEHERLDRADPAKSQTPPAPVTQPHGSATLDPALIRLVLRHLVLFRLPVEIWVLMGCPLIYRHLREAFKEKYPGNTQKPSEMYRERAFILEMLSFNLKELCGRCLVIEIEPSQNSELGEAKREDEERRLHMRYALHAGLREHFAYHMQLQISDEGDLNHHQMSVFCDQPRDLPTPRSAHFEMIQEIVSHMIERCRIMLDATYRTTWSGKQYKRTRWDPHLSEMGGETNADEQTTRAYRRAAEHVFFPFTSEASDEGPRLDPEGIAGSMGQIHAVPQRLRACFSMLQTALTVGSLSRLDTVHLKPGDEPPFETYRGWLRGLLNAAVGLERNRDELGLLLDGSVFKTASLPSGSDTIGALGLTRLKNRIADAKVSLSAQRQNELDLLLNEVKSGMLAVCKQACMRGLFERQTTKYKVLRHPFYRDEIAWLYNERGLTSFMQGRLFDAIPLFKQARFIMAHAQTPPFDSKAYNAAERRINLNLALAFIERGKIGIARQMLNELEVSLRHVKRSTPSKVHGFARGYLAFCDHLSGSFEGALSEYEACLRGFVERRDLRAVSIFHRLMGDLYFRTGQYEKAKPSLEMAVNSASQAEQRDVENHALLSLALFEIETNKQDLAQGRIRRVLHYATQMGLYRLEAEAQLAEGKLNMKRGELALAAEAIARSIAMSSRHGLRLIKLSGLVAYGQIQFTRSEYALSQSVLEEAKREAETLGFQLEASEAADILAGISPLLTETDRASTG